MRPDARKITVRQLLTSRWGLGDNGGVGPADAAALSTCFQWGLDCVPGTVFARKYLFDPIGVAAATCREQSKYTDGHSWLRLATRDMARFGYLYLRRGRWNGRQVVPADWVADSTREQRPIPVAYRAPGIDDSHGYLWWTPATALSLSSGHPPRDLEMSAAGIYDDGSLSVTWNARNLELPSLPG